MKTATDNYLGVVEAAQNLLDQYNEGVEAYEELDAEYEALEKSFKIAESACDDYRAMLADATDEIERLKKMAFEEIVREVAEEKLNQ